MKNFFALTLFAVLIVPLIASAHGFVADGHEAALTWIDFVELGAITLGSIGLLAYSFRQYRGKDKK